MAYSLREGAGEKRLLRSRVRRRYQYVIRLLPLVIVLVLSTGCQITQSAFSRKSGAAGAEFAAAALTLKDEHEGTITRAYAQSSFVNYASGLQGLDQQLPNKSGAPDRQTVHTLLRLITPALAAVQHPCLDASCDWQKQVTALDHASDALVKASDS